MEGSCQCGAVKFITPAPTPSVLYICHCTECRKQSASAFGTTAIFPYFNLSTDENVSYFKRKFDSGRSMNCYFCNKCGTRVLHAHIVEGGEPKRVAVKGGLLDGLDWSTAKHIFCRSAVTPIPEDVVRFEAEPAM